MILVDDSGNKIKGAVFFNYGSFSVNATNIYGNPGLKVDVTLEDAVVYRASSIGAAIDWIIEEQKKQFDLDSFN